MKKYVILLCCMLLWVFNANAQCVGGTINNCPAATNIVPSDVLLGYQQGQNPHTRKFPVGNLSTFPWLRASSYGVVADGVTSDDLALKAAIDACAAAGTTLILPPGKILLTGVGSTTSTIQSCKLQGSGFFGGIVAPFGNGTPSYGTTILLTSTTVRPFYLRYDWALDGINFYYPNQTGAVVYPPLFSDDGTHHVGYGTINNVGVANPYDGFKATVGIDWSNIVISNSLMYAAHDLFRMNSSGDSWRISNTHFTHALWAGIVGYPTVAAYLNTADQNNTIFHIDAGSSPATVTVAMGNTTTFAWRYGVKLEAGGNFTNSTISGAWDGVATFMDSSAANACLSNTTISGSGWSFYTPVFDSGGGVSGTGTAPAFNLGAGNANCHGPVIKDLNTTGPGRGSFLVSAGQEVDIDGVQAVYGTANDGSDYYGVYVTANPGQTTLNVRNTKFIPGGAAAKMHGIKAPVLSLFKISDINISGVQEAIDANSSTDSVIQLTNNNFASTNGTASVVIAGTGFVLYRGNVADKPSNAVVSSCGSGATSSGIFVGGVQIGSTNPTTACTIALPWRPYGGGGCVANTAAGAIAIGAGVTGNPPVWTFTSAADMHGSQLFFNCLGGQ